MAESFKFDLVLPRTCVFSEEVIQVIVPAAGGYITILPGHEVMVGTVRPGIIEILQEPDQKKSFFVRNGFIDVSFENVVLLSSRIIPLDMLTSQDVEVERQLAKDFLEAAADCEEARLLAAQFSRDLENAFARASFE